MTEFKLILIGFIHFYYKTVYLQIYFDLESVFPTPLNAKYFFSSL